ncbi:MAG: site-2 protease family protein [Actinomycetota bacterium]
MKSLLTPSIVLLRVRGIRLSIHWSWLVVFALVTWSLAVQLFPFAYPGLPPRTYWLMAGVSALVFFASIALHELGHALQAAKEGMRIHDITLWLFGGVARFQGMFPTAAAELRIAVAGPVVSLLLAGLFAAARVALGSAAWAVEIAGVVDYLARINLLLALFNLIPALPLDGGRILRAWLWRTSGSFVKATRLASGAGRAFAYALMALGAVSLVFWSTLQGIWFVLLGIFLWRAALAELRHAQLRQSFEGRLASDLMGSVDNDGYVALGSEGGAVAAHRPASEVLDLVLERPGPLAVVQEGAVVGQVSRANVARFLKANGPASTGSRARRFSWSTVFLVLAVALPVAGSLYRPPVLLVSAGSATDLSGDVTITGVPSEKPTGSYLLVSIHLSRPNALRAGLSALNPEVDVVPRSTFLPAGVSEEEYFQAQLAVFEESRIAAAAAAASAAGLPVELSGEGARIEEVLAGSPAQGKLRAGDVVKQVDGVALSLAAELSDETKSRPAGTAFDLTVQRGRETVEVTVFSRALEGFTSTGRGIGVITTTDKLDVELPFEIEFAERRIGGPSAGLAYGLVIADMLDPRDLAAERRIAASGTIGLEGEVGAVGGLRQKAITASEADASVLVVPRSEASAANSDLQVLGVDSLKHAMTALSPAA